MFKKEIKPLSEAMVEKIAKSINKMEYVEEKVEVESLDESKALLKDYQDMKTQGKKDSSIMDVLMSMPKYKKMSRDQMAKVIGDAKRKGIFKEELEESNTQNIGVDLMKKYGAGSKVVKDKAGYFHIKYKDGNNTSSVGHFNTLDDVMKHLVKEEVELDESKERVILKKGNYTFVNNDEDETVHVKLNGKNIARGQFDSGPGGWFFSVKGQRGQKFFREPEDVINFFMKESLDPVDAKALKGKHSERKDKDIDNDGDVDSSDEYLHKRRQAISKALAKEEVEQIDEAKTQGNYARVIYDYSEDYYLITVYKNGKEVAKDSGYFGANETGNPLIKKFTDVVRKAGLKPEGLPIVDDEGKKGVFKGNTFKWGVKEEVEQIDEGAVAATTVQKEIQKNGGSRIKNDGTKMTFTMNGKQHSVAVDRGYVKDNDYMNLQKMFEGVELDEAKSATGYTINHKTFSSAVQHAKVQVEKQGYTIDDDEWDRKVAMGPKKPGTGKTNRYTIDLMKDGKESKRKLQMQVYYDEGRYELNMYVS